MSIVYTETDKQTGITSKVHELDSGKVVIEKQYDVEPFLQTAAEIRAETEGERWGEMRHVGFIPMAELATMMRQDGTIDQKRCIEFLKKNPAFVTFSKVLK
jgi:hypothetical protein